MRDRASPLTILPQQPAAAFAELAEVQVIARPARGARVERVSAEGVLEPEDEVVTAVADGFRR